MNLTRYLLISTICLSISYALFRLIYRNGIRFRQQRVFLITSLLLSIFLPLSGFRITIPRSETVLGEIGTSIQTPIAQSYSQSMIDSGFYVPDFSELIVDVYSAIAFLFLFLLVFQNTRLFWIIRISKKERHNNILIIKSEKVKSPFSFFNWVFLPKNLSDPEEIESIIIHESIHASQLHSADNLLFELATALMWFNPLIWMSRKSIRLVHEYLADEGTLKAGIEKIWYQALLLNQASEDTLIYIPSGFNSNLLKKRLIMITKNKIEGRNRFSMLNFITLPISLCLVLAVMNGLFPLETKAADQSLIEKKDQKEKSKQEFKTEAKKNPDEQNAATKEIIVIGYGNNPDKTNEVQVSGYKNQDNQDVNQNGIKIRSRDSSGTDSLIYIIDGVHSSSIEHINPDSIESINVMKTDRTIIVRTKKFAKEHADKEKSENVALRSGGISSINENTVIILDEKEMTKGEFENLHLPADSIKSISVLKGESTKIYSKKDVDAIIVITTKK